MNQTELLRLWHLIPWATVVAVAGKLFVDAAGTMPAPSENVSYLGGWIFDFIQTLAANKGRVGERRKLAAPQAPAPPHAPASPAAYVSEGHESPPVADAPTGSRASVHILA